jgi:hypothetical protein
VNSPSIERTGSGTISAAGGRQAASGADSAEDRIAGEDGRVEDGRSWPRVSRHGVLQTTAVTFSLPSCTVAG